MLIFCTNDIYAQTEEEKAEAWKPVEKILNAQFELAKLLKDANTIKIASNILRNDTNCIMSADSIDVEISNNRVVSVLFYERDAFYEYKNRFPVLYDDATKKTYVDKTANIDLKGIRDGNSRRYKLMPLRIYLMVLGYCLNRNDRFLR